MTTNELANKILALLENVTYGEADAALHDAADYLAKKAQKIIAATPISKSQAVWTPPKKF